MRILWFAALSLSLTLALPACAVAASPPSGADLAAAQRGYAVYAEVCSACHSMRQVTYGQLQGLGLTDTQVAALAHPQTVADADAPSGQRPGRPSDSLPLPFPSDAAARTANGGSLPPDLSRIALTRHGGAGGIAALLTGYTPPPPGFERQPGTFYNAATRSHRIAMPPPLHAGQVAFTDGTAASEPQMAHDVASFLDWAAHPHQIERRRVGIGVLVYLLLLAVLVFLLKRRVWSNVAKS